MTEFNEYRYPVRLVAGGVIGLAGLNWIAAPEKVEAWAGVSIVVLVALGAAPRLAERFRSRSTDERTAISRSLFLAALTIGFALIATLLKSWGLADGAVAKRFVGAVIGAVLIACGDQLPKYVPAPSERLCDPARAQAAERFVGRVLTVGGFFYVAAWLFSPIDRAPMASTAIGLFVFLTAVLAACTVYLPGRSRMR